jgi:mannitol/fructose-specific phosphotransferase system IIA component (Ntr-type)
MLDRFDRLVARSPVLDLNRTMKFDECLEIAIASLALQSDVEPAVLADAFLRRERMSSSILAPGLAIPHVLVDGEDQFHLLVARSRGGVTFPGQEEAVHSIFLIIRSADERAMHLKSLAAIAQTVQDPSFDERWLTAWGAEEIRRILLVAERRRFHEFEMNGQEKPTEVESV